MVVAYAYNAREPRFYSKYTAARNKTDYDITIADAVEASTAMPGFFKPKVINKEVIVDGALIANNPSYFADSFARHLYDKENIFTMSVGAGREEVIPFAAGTQVSAITWLMRMQSLIISAGMRTHEYMSELLSVESEKYQRFTSISYDAVSKVDKLKLYGQELFVENLEEIQAAMTKLLDRKFPKKL